MAHARGEKSDDLILRLTAVARGLEDEGQNNIAKLFRAAALSEVYREEQGRPRQGDGLEAAVRSVVEDLTHRDTTPEALKSALTYAVGAFERGEWPMLSDIPHPSVCRFCGEVVIGDAPDTCPTCDARRYTFQPIPPIFYLDRLEPSELEGVLEANLEDVDRSVRGVSEEDADRGVWPMRDMMSHLVGAQELMVRRAKQMLAEDNPNLGSVPPTEVGAANGNTPTGMADLLNRFHQTRREVLELVRSLTDDEFARYGMHPEWGQLTVLSQLTYMARHEQSHLAELQARREGR